jgi:3-polyprenyl-4-hydroxybenzoate decarboxylase
MRMGAKERILSIRLLEKLKEKPAYAETLGVEAAQKMCEKESERANL